MIFLDQHHELITGLAWRGQTIYSASLDQTIRATPLEGDPKVLSRRVRGYRRMDVSPDGTMLSALDGDDILSFWSLSGVEAEEVKRVKIPQGILTVSWSPNSQLLAVGGGDGLAELWDRGTLKRVQGHHHGGDRGESWVSCLAWSPGSDKIAWGGNRTGRLEVWDVQQERKVLVNKTHYNSVTALSWSPDGTRIASSSLSHDVRVWEAETGRPVSKYLDHVGQVNALAWSPDGSRIASGSSDRTVQVWDPGGGKTLKVYRGHGSLVHVLSWSPDSRQIVSGGFDALVHLWTVPSLERELVVSAVA